MKKIGQLATNKKVAKSDLINLATYFDSSYIL